MSLMRLTVEALLLFCLLIGLQVHGIMRVLGSFTLKLERVDRHRIIRVIVYMKPLIEACLLQTLNMLLWLLCCCFWAMDAAKELGREIDTLKPKAERARHGWIVVRGDHGMQMF